MNMDPRYMVKQYLNRIVKADGRVWDVFNTGVPGVVLFVPIVGADAYGQGGFTGTVSVPVLRRDLKRSISRMLPRR